MQKGTQLLLVFLLSAVVAVGAATFAGVHLGGDGARPRPVRTPAPGAGTERLAIPQGAAAAGHLREAQDGFLKILIDNPEDAAAMRGLIAVRRQLAGDDPVVLRRQAIAYRQMAASGAEPPEHYSQKALQLLASASLQAAAALESEQRGAAGRTNGPPVPGVPRGATPSDKGAFAPPALPAAPGQSDKVNSLGSAPARPAPAKGPNPSAPTKPSDVPPAQAGASPTAPAEAPTVSPPQTSPAPPTGSTAPEQPAPEQTTPPTDSSGGTIAVVPPTTAGPAPAQSEGSLARVDCQKKAFVLNDTKGDQEYVAASNFTIYVRGLGSERVADFCGLQRYLGRTALVWWVPDGDRKIAKSMSVLPPQ